MSRNNSTYKETYNRGLDFIKSLDIGAKLPAEKELSEKWGISRTTVRAVLTHLMNPISSIGPDEPKRF